MAGRDLLALHGRGRDLEPDLDYAGYPNRVNKYTMDISSVPWLDFGENPTAPAQTPKLGWMNESIEIDPFDSDRMLYGTGATVYGTTQLTNWDTGTPFTITPFVEGLEETAVLDWSARRPARRWSPRSATSAASTTRTWTRCRPPCTCRPRWAATPGWTSRS